jgi:Bacterial PH domain
MPAVIFAAIAARAWAAGTAGVAAGALAALLALAVAVHQFLSAFLARVLVHDTGIERVGVATRRRVGWKTIARVAYNPVNRWFMLTTSDGGHLWLSEDLRGIGEFAAVALRRVPPGAFSDALAREALDDLAEEARAATDATPPPGAAPRVE